MWERIKLWAKSLKRDVIALWIAARSSRTPVVAKVVAAAVAAYALNPIDLIPDFIPVLGYLDDIVIVPLGIALAVRLVPAALMAGFRTSAASMPRPVNKQMAIVIVLVWIISLVALGGWLWKAFR